MGDADPRYPECPYGFGLVERYVVHGGQIDFRPAYPITPARC